MASEPDRSFQRTLIDQANAEMGRQRISRRQLARLTGIHRNTLDRLFLCERDLNVAQWDAIATALGFDPGDLAGAALAAARSRDGRSRPAVEANPPPGSDPRGLITWLLNHPAQDEELNTRLSDSASRTGLSGRRLVALQETIRAVRREELINALDALPPSSGDRADRQSG